MKSANLSNFEENDYDINCGVVPVTRVAKP